MDDSTMYRRRWLYGPQPEDARRVRDFEQRLREDAIENARNFADDDAHIEPFRREVEKHFKRDGRAA